MRRSLAPSQSSEAKRGKFVPIFSKSKQNGTLCSSLENTTHENTNLPKTNLNSKRSTLDVIKLVENVDTGWKENITNPSQEVDLAFDEKLETSPKNDSNESHLNILKEVYSNDAKDGFEKFFKVLWCKRSSRKHKKWEGDAVLIVKKRSTILKDMDGKFIGSGMGYKHSELENLEEGSQLVIGGKEIEVMDIISSSDYGSGKCFVSETAPTLQSFHQMDTTNASIRPFRNPNKLAAKKTESVIVSAKARHDPLQLGAFVMPRPRLTHQYQNADLNQPIVDVVVDPILTNKLRPHQKEGVTFLYECLTQIRQFHGQGAILADEMGLGKTLQCITLLWTMLKQGPYGGKPLIKKILIVTPSSLMKNWQKEFNTWLGRERISICLANQSDKIETYAKSPLQSVMITSYELSMRHSELLEKIKFDILICDEGHRLKNANTKTSLFLGHLSVNKRIALTGTPIQNDLQEFFSLVDFCNPGILGSMTCFKKVYETPIIRGKQPSATIEEISLGELRSSELSRLTSQFILRRTQDINNKYLPAKVEYVVFCKPSQLQLSLYTKLIASRSIKSCLDGTTKDGSFHLICISGLKKLCNHPALIYEAAKEASELPPEYADDSSYSGLLALFPENFNKFAVPPTEFSGKQTVLTLILQHIKLLEPKERVVLVSNSTKTLDVLEKLCKVEKHSYLRLDGSTPQNNRQDLVDRFNAAYSDAFVFLLSSKAGGVGLNLIGASRLILYDIDWNPANDLQAMSRVWRDGQKKVVHIYRLLTTGTIEEKIYQRQITKQSLTTVLAKGTHKKMQFSAEDLKDLFTLNRNSQCSTHDLMECNCINSNLTSLNDSLSEIRGSRSAQIIIENSWNKSKNLTIDELMLWKHICGQDIDKSMIQKSCLDGAKNAISFLFYNLIKEVAS